MPRRKSFGQKLADEIGEGVLNHEQHRRILAVDNGEQIANLLCADVGDAMCPNIKAVHDLLGDCAKAKLSIPNVIISLRFFSAAQMMRVIEEAQQTLDGKQTKEERLQTLRLKREAVSEFDKIIGHIQRLCTMQKYIEKFRITRRIHLNEPVTEAPRVQVGHAPELE